VRRISITNRTQKRREIEVTSYAEVYWHLPQRTRCIRRFGNLFVQTESFASSGHPLYPPAAV